MTTKQNAIDLANTARSEAANTAKRTIAVIIANWNECVKQAGFTGVFDFPTTGYSRKSQLIADLERCAAQLDDYVEPVVHPAGYTVEQQTREINATLTRVLDANEAHSEALELDKLLEGTATINLAEAGNMWEMEATHTEALRMNLEFDRAHEADALCGKWWCSNPIIACEYEAQEMDAIRSQAIADQSRGFSITKKIQWLWDNTYSEAYKIAWLEAAHTEALTIETTYYRECA